MNTLKLDRGVPVEMNCFIFCQIKLSFEHELMHGFHLKTNIGKLIPKGIYLYCMNASSWSLTGLTCAEENITCESKTCEVLYKIAVSFLNVITVFGINTCEHGHRNMARCDFMQSK